MFSRINNVRGECKGGNVHFLSHPLKKQLKWTKLKFWRVAEHSIHTNRAKSFFCGCHFTWKHTLNWKHPGMGLYGFWRGTAFSVSFWKKLLFCMTSIIYRTCGSITYCRSFLEKCCHDLKIVAMHFENF